MALDTSITIRLKDQLTRGLKRMRGGVGKFKEEFQKASRSFEMAGHLSNAAQGVESLGRSARGMVQSVVQPAVDFEESIARLGGLTGSAGEDLKALEAKAKELGSSTRFSASEAAAGMEDLARAGLSTDEMLETIGPTLDLATAGGLELSRAADISTNIMAGLGLEVSETQRTMDVLARASQRSNTNVQLLGESMKFAAPLAKQAGVELEEVTAAAGKLGDAGIKGSEAGTSLRAMLQRLSATTPQGAKALKELGVETEDSEGNLRNFTDILAEMSKGLEDVGGTRRAQLVKDLFETEAAGAANVLIDAAGAGELQDLTKELKGSQGAAGDFADEIKDTTAGGLKEFESQMESLKIQIGTELLPVVNDLLEDLKPIITDIRDWVKENPELARTLGSMLIKLAAVTTALAPLLRALAALRVSIGLTQTAIAGAKGLKAAFGAAGTGADGLKSKLGRRAGLAGAFAVAITGAVALGLKLREIYDNAGAVGESRREKAEIADFYRQQGYSEDEIWGEGGKVHTTRRLATGKVVSAEGEVIKEATKAGKERMAAGQREQDLKLIRRLARGEGVEDLSAQKTADIVRNARSDDEQARERAEAALEARGLTDEQVERIVKAMRESRQEIKVTVDASSGEEVDSGRQPAGGG